MALPVYPPGVSSQGNTRAIYVPTLVAAGAPDISSELNAAGAVDFSCFLLEDQFNFTGEQARGEDRRFCSKESFETLGVAKRGIADLQYVFDPQAAAALPENRAYEVFKKDVTGFFIVRMGFDARTVDWAAGQKVDVWPIKFGLQVKVLGGGEFAKFNVTQAVAVTAPPTEDVALVA
jgi:hypothetical protein